MLLVKTLRSHKATGIYVLGRTKLRVSMSCVGNYSQAYVKVIMLDMFNIFSCTLILISDVFSCTLRPRDVGCV